MWGWLARQIQRTKVRIRNDFCLIDSSTLRRCSGQAALGMTRGRGVDSKMPRPRVAGLTKSVVRKIAPYRAIFCC